MSGILHTTFSVDHICAELFWSAVLDVALYPLIRAGVRRHDRRVHGGVGGSSVGSDQGAEARKGGGS